MYADIALTLGKHLQDRYWSQVKEQVIDISDMVIEKALIAAPRGPQLLRTAVELKWDYKSALCRFLSVNVRFTLVIPLARFVADSTRLPVKKQLSMAIVRSASKTNPNVKSFNSGYQRLELAWPNCGQGLRRVKHTYSTRQ